MKLKKIASLMLAGVMAVSMLAACDGKGSSSSSSSEPTEPTSSYSADLQKKLSATANSKVKLSDSSELDKALTYAMGNIGDDSITAGFWASMTEGGSVYYVQDNIGYTSAESVVNDLRTALKVDSTMKWSANVQYDIENLTPNTYSDHAAYWNKNDVNTVLVFICNSGISMDNALDKVADMIDTGIVNVATTYKTPSGEDNNMEYNYTGSVAASTKTFEGLKSGVTVIAVELVRHIGK